MMFGGWIGHLHVSWVFWKNRPCVCSFTIFNTSVSQLSAFSGTKCSNCFPVVFSLQQIPRPSHEDKSDEKNEEDKTEKSEKKEDEEKKDEEEKDEKEDSRSVVVVVVYCIDIVQ